MIFKEIICVLLLAISLQIASAENDKVSDLNNREDHYKQVVDFKSVDEESEKKFGDAAALQFQKDYNNWGDEKFGKDGFKEHKGRKNYIKVTELESKEFVDKYNKYGNTFNPNILYKQREKMAHHQKSASGNDEPQEEGNLLRDIDVNYINNNKKVSGDSELITENPTQKTKEKYQENYQNGNELYMKRFKKDFYQNLINLDTLNPPPPNDTIMMARYIVHAVDWAALATLSGRSPTKGFPFVCVKATSDGMRNASSGIPLFYMSSMDLCTQDLEKNNQVSVLMTLSQTEYCKKENLDPQDPRCAKLTLSGKIKKIKAGSDEEKFAKSALFSRHPAMESWPADHHWYFSKLKIGQIILLDQFGGATFIKVKDYLNGKIITPELKRK